MKLIDRDVTDLILFGRCLFSELYSNLYEIES